MKADSIRFAVLGSGSAANSYIFEHGDFSFVIDNGYTLTEFKRRASALDFDIQKVNFIFLTHHHSDHFKGVESLSSFLDVPVVTHTDMNIEKHCKKKTGLKRLDINPGQNYNFDSLDFQCFETSHDAHCSIGFHFNLDKTAFTLITDTGCITEDMAVLALKSDYLFLESNYSPELLHKGPYPGFLKKRILSDKGHLSNLDAAAFMQNLSERDKKRLKKIFLCHLSENNNNVEKVKEEISRMYSGNIPYKICSRNESISHESLIRH